MRTAGFALVDLVVALVLTVTLAGLAGLYYADAQKERLRVSATNQLDEYTKACVAWELARRSRLTVAIARDAQLRKNPDKPLHVSGKYYTLQFLVEDGRLKSLERDPWGGEYYVDPLQCLVLSFGQDGVPDTIDDADLKRSFCSANESLGSDPDALISCKAPPVIVSFDPCETVVKTSKPLVRVRYRAAKDCAIDVQRVQLFVDQADRTDVVKAAGELSWSPTAALGDGNHDIVAVVRDTQGNEARRQCSFLVDTNPAVILLTKPPSGQAVCEAFAVEGAVIDKALKSWVLEWDFRQLARGETEVGSTAFDGRIVPAVVLERFDTASTTNPVEDGRHFLTLSARDRTGQIRTAQSEVIVDNSNPKGIIAKGHPGASGNPPVITTDIVRISGVAQDSLMVRDVRYWFYERTTGLLAEGQPTQGTTAVPIRWDPLDLTTQRNWWALYNAPVVEWSTLPSKGTTAEQRDAGFNPVRLVPGEYRCEVRVKDLCGNESAVVTTDFNINLSTGGLTGTLFLDGNAVTRGPPYVEEDRQITSLPNAGIPVAQTQGKVRFVALEAGHTPRATWEVVIDDNGGSDQFSGDGTFVTTGPNRDWVATGALPTTTNLPVLTDLYIPNGTNPYETATTNQERRNNLQRAGPMAEGLYKIRVRYTNDLGEGRSVVTTFLLDNSYPLIPATGGVDERAIEYRLFNPGGAPLFCGAPHMAPVQVEGQTKPPVIEAFSQPTADQGQIEFKGQCRDYPTSGVITQVSWLLGRDPPGAEPATTLQQASVFAATGSARRTNVASYGYVGGVLSTMNMSSSTPGGLDGLGYYISISATDGAGLSTSVLRDFTINTAGPLIRNFDVINARGGTPVRIEPPIGNLPTVTDVDGQEVSVRFSSADEVPITKIEYNVFRQAGNSTAGIPRRVPLILGTNTVETVGLTITRDDDNQPLRSLPTTYQLRITAANFNKDGTTFATALGFRFLSNFAVYAPHYSKGTAAATFRTLAATNASWLGYDEQVATADFLFSNVRTSDTRKIFNTTGNLAGPQQSTIESDSDSIDAWVSRATANQTTDVLVVLDAFPDSIWNNSVDDPIVRFLESRPTGATVPTTGDGDVLVFVGEMPFAWAYNTLGRRRAIGTSGRAGGHRTVLRVPGASPDNVYQMAPDTASPAGAPDNPAFIQRLGPLGSSSAFLPSLFEYDPYFDHNRGGSGDPHERQLEPVPRPLGVPLVGTNWVIDRLFSIDQDKLALAGNSAASLSGGNFQLRHQNTRALIAHFLCSGPAASADSAFPAVTPGNRKPIAVLGAVIRDYVDKHVLNQVEVVQGSRRIYFNAKSDPAFAGVAGGSGARDVVYWPSTSEGYVNVTTVTAADQTANLQAVSANRAMVYTSAKQPAFGPSFEFASPSLFRFPPGEVVLEQGVNVRPILDADISANGVSLTFSSTCAVNADPAGNTAFDTAVVFFKTIGAGATLITTGRGALSGPANHPRLSADGQFVVFDSLNVYRNSPPTAPPNFLNLTKTDAPRIYRYSASRAGNDVYFDGEVVKTRLGADAASSRPVVSRDGKFVVFQTQGAVLPGVVTANPRTQLALAFNRTPGGADPWVIGALTADTAGDSLFPDMTADSAEGGNYPLVVYQSAVNYEGALPGGSGSGSEDLDRGLLGTSRGAQSGAVPELEDFSSIYLFAGNFSRKILRVARGSDADCLHPRLSPDGEEVVFESRATVVTGFLSVSETGTVQPQDVKNVTGGPAGPNRVYRVRIRPNPLGASPSAVIQRITPAAVDLGGDARPCVAN